MDTSYLYGLVWDKCGGLVVASIDHDLVEVTNCISS